MNKSKSLLIDTEATMNQMRNSIYHLERFMTQNGCGETEIKERLRRMGRNIAQTFINYWSPIEDVTLLNVKDVLSTIYQKIVGSAVSIEVHGDEKLIRVKDNKCALCKYHYDDINVGGCEILLGLVSEFISLISKESNNLSSIVLEPYNLQASRALGNDSCIQVFKFKTGGR